MAGLWPSGLDHRLAEEDAARASTAIAAGSSPRSTRRTWTSGIRKVQPTRTAKPRWRLQVRQAVMRLTPVRPASSAVETNVGDCM